MRQKVLYMILAACLLLTNASDAFAKSRKKVEDPEITKLKGKIENVMQKVDAQPDWRLYEPSSDTEPGDIASVDYFMPSEEGAVGIIVKLKNGTEQRIVCSENGKVSLFN